MNEATQTETAQTDDNENRTASTADTSNPVDSEGTDQTAAREMLVQLRDKGFDGSNEKFAVALGRNLDDITKFLNGDATIDDDMVMKARGIATLRGVNL